MRNLKPYKGDSFSFYLGIIDSLKTDDSKLEHLQRVEDVVSTSYKVYDSKFINNELSTIEPSKINDKSKEVLRNLYNFRRKSIANLFSELMTDPDNRLSGKCPYCLNSEANSFDHFLPKKRFPEFAIHPTNLIPSCSFCNQKKSEKYAEFLNLYLDAIPTDRQFLFVSFTFSDKCLIAEYYLKKDPYLSEDLFSKIRKTFNRLELCERYKRASHQMLVDVIKDINLLRSKLSDTDVIREELLRQYKIYYEKYDVNDWEYVFKKSCVEDASVFEFLFQNCDNLL